MKKQTLILIFGLIMLFIFIVGCIDTGIDSKKDGCGSGCEDCKCSYEDNIEDWPTHEKELSEDIKPNRN